MILITELSGIMGPVVHALSLSVVKVPSVMGPITECCFILRCCELPSVMGPLAVLFHP